MECEVGQKIQAHQTTANQESISWTNAAVWLKLGSLVCNCLFVLFSVSQCGGLLWPDNPGRRHDRQLTPGVQKVLLCDQGDWLPPHYAGQLSKGQGPVPLSFLPGLQFTTSGPSEPSPSLPRVPSWLCPSQPQTGAHHCRKFGGPLSCWVLHTVLWWTWQELTSTWTSSVRQESATASAVHRKLPDPEAGDLGDSAQSWLCGGLHLLQTRWDTFTDMHITDCLVSLLFCWQVIVQWWKKCPEFSKYWKRSIISHNCIYLRAFK